MRKAKWYNWVGDPYWDDYCRIAWLVIIISGLTIMALLFIGIATGYIEVVE